MTIYEADDIHQFFIENSLERPKLCLNLADVGEVDTTAFQIIVSLAKTAKQNGVTFHIEKSSNTIEDIFSLYEQNALFVELSSES